MVAENSIERGLDPLDIENLRRSEWEDGMIERQVLIPVPNSETSIGISDDEIAEMRAETEGMIKKH